MSFYIEVCYMAPDDDEKEYRLFDLVQRHEGRFDYREKTGMSGQTVCLTYEFNDRSKARLVVEELRSAGEFVDGPNDYD